MLAIEIIIILIIIMFLVAFLYSNLGLGGGMLYVPIMVFIATSMERLEIIPISLFLSFMTQVPAAYTHFKRDFVRIKLGFVLALATLPGVIIGIILGVRTEDSLAFGLFAVLMIFTGFKMMYDVYKNKFEGELPECKITSYRCAIAFIISIGTGMISAFFGVGGGIITVPVLIYIIGLYPRRAIGTSAFMIIITSMAGFLCYFLLSIENSHLTALTFHTIPPIDYSLAIILGIVVIVGAYLGSSWGLSALKTKNIQFVFILILFIVGVQLLLRALGYI